MPRARILPVALVTVAVVTLGACDGGSGGDPTDPATSAAASGSSDPNESPEPTEPTEPTGPAAATGIVIDQDGAQFNAPEGWVEQDRIVTSQHSASDPDSVSAIRLGEIQAFGDQTPAELAESRIRLAPYPVKPERLPETVLDGVEVYHVAGDIGDGHYLEEYGAIYAGNIVTLEFDLDDSIRPPERDALIASVVASFRWK